MKCVDEQLRVLVKVMNILTHGVMISQVGKGTALALDEIHEICVIAKKDSNGMKRIEISKLYGIRNFSRRSVLSGRSIPTSPTSRVAEHRELFENKHDPTRKH